MRAEPPEAHREIDQIENEFQGMLRQHWKRETAQQRFEVLWDEVNSAAVHSLHTEVGVAYIALLGRMQRAFDDQYHVAALQKANGFKSSAF